MQNPHSRTLIRAFSDILAELAFMLTEEGPAAAPPPEACLEARIAYDGPAAGVLRLRCTREFTGLLAANLLGADPQQPHADGLAEDAVKEFMNILGGQLVTRIHGCNEVFNLSLPEVTHPARAEPDPEKAGDVTVRFCAEGHPIELVYQPVTPALPPVCGLGNGRQEQPRIKRITDP